MSGSPSPISRLVPKRADAGGLYAALLPMPGGFDTWRHGVHFTQWQPILSAQPVDSYTNPTTNVTTCRSGLGWDCYPLPAAHNKRMFFPTDLAVVDGCPTAVGGGAFGPDIEDRDAAVAAAIADPSPALARYLWTGQSGLVSSTAWDVPDQPALWDATDVSAATAGSPVKVFSLLERAIREAGYFGPIWFHMPSWALYPIMARGMLDDLTDTVLRMTGGNLVIADRGYPGSLAAGVAAAGTSWVVATPPVWGAVNDPTSPVDYYPPTDIDCQFDTWRLQKRMGIVMYDQLYARRALMTVDA